MSIHLHREIDDLKRHILTLGTLVEENLRRAIDAIVRRDTIKAAQVVDLDTSIDLREVDVEEECLKALALYQPVAADLRFIVSVLKLNNDLERIGDKAVSIAERAAALAQLPSDVAQPGFHDMAERVQFMLKRSLDALVNLDLAMARQVCAMDDEIDALNRGNYEVIKQGIRARPDLLDAWIAALAVSRNLERIADHCTNIAEDVVYLIEGDIVRHRPPQGGG